ncbi:MAG: glycerol-3-phosphate acyltransferase [Actinomycetia bacterium]|nr:glycerol-3-phosphate acyltransferase [Actinomycetes bacterium]
MVDTIYFKIIYIIAGYMLGSVLFSYIMVKIYGRKDGIRDFSNIDRPGTAGAGRQYGLKAGLPTFIFDAGKGVAVVLVGQAIGLDQLVIAIACVAVMVGHNWPIWFKFRGGGGLATAMGIAGALMLIPFLILLAIVLAVGFTYKYTLGRTHKINPNVISGALGAILFPVFAYIYAYIYDMSMINTYFYNGPMIVVFIAAAISLIIILKGIILHFMYRKIPTANKF